MFFKTFFWETVAFWIKYFYCGQKKGPNCLVANFILCANGSFFSPKFMLSVYLHVFRPVFSVFAHPFPCYFFLLLCREKIYTKKIVILIRTGSPKEIKFNVAPPNPYWFLVGTEAQGGKKSDFFWVCEPLSKLFFCFQRKIIHIFLILSKTIFFFINETAVRGPNEILLVLLY